MKYGLSYRTTAVLSALLLMFVATFALLAQEDKSKRPSPPATATTTFDGITVTVNYSQPAKKGREIFGALVPFEIGRAHV